MNLNFKIAFLLVLILGEGNAQVTGPIFKPGKMEIYYPDNSAQWELYSTTYYSYNQAGKEILKTEKNAYGTPVKKDSLVYDEKGVMKEAHSFAWSVSENKFVNSKKDIYCVNDNGSCGELNYKWTGTWDLQTGTEVLTSYSENNLKITQIHRYFDGNKDKWFNSIQVETILDELGQDKIITYYSANQTDNSIFDLFTRVSVSGWLDYKNRKHTQKVTEEFVGGKWVKTEVSTMERIQLAWVELLERFNIDGSEKEIYRLVNYDNESREVYLKYDNNWLLKSNVTMKENEQIITENHFDKDSLLSAAITSTVYDSKGNVIKVGEFMRDANGRISDFFQMDYLHTYNPQDLLVEETSYFKEEETGPSLPVIRKVYSDYVKIGNTTSLAKSENKIKFEVYPNPGNGVFNLTGIENAARVSILNTSGIIVGEKEIVSKTINLSDIPAGIYFLKITNGEESVMAKVVLE